MNFAFYQDYLFQTQEFMDKQGKNFVILNFMSHPVKPGFYPKVYTIIDLPMHVNIFTENIDIKIMDYVKKTIVEAGYDEFNFQPLVVLPQYQPIQFLIFHIVSELFGITYPIITQIGANADDIIAPYYLVATGLRKRLRPKRPDIEKKGLIIE